MYLLSQVGVSWVFGRGCGQIPKKHPETKPAKQLGVSFFFSAR
jgi:hypothetical protein